MEEFALCWNNFQENLASGFQNLLDRGDLVDVTIAVENRLIQAHKIVLAICSPYFQEMFQQNPCKHPIIILKDVSYSVMSELLQFMYQGEVNVKHIELPTFMKIAETLQIKGLTTPSSSSSKSPAMHSLSHHRRSPLAHMSASQSQPQHLPNKNISSCDSNLSSPQPPSSYIATNNNNNNQSVKLETPGSSQKRDYGANNAAADAYYAKAAKIAKRSVGSSDVTENSNGPEMNDSMDNMGDDVFMPPIPQISMSEGGRFDLNNVKRENPESAASPAPRQQYYEQYNNATSGASSSSGYTPSKEYANDMHDFGNNKGHHMEIPPGINNITMLSSTSLLHGNCIFNRNNTVATQQGMKTYWLCKSYRITMCRARCITHQGRVISATGVHNHSPHMKNGPGSENTDPNQPPPQPIVISSSAVAVSLPPPPSAIQSSSLASRISTSMAHHGPPPPPNSQFPPPNMPQSHHLPISAVPGMPPNHQHPHMTHSSHPPSSQGMPPMLNPPPMHPAIHQQMHPHHLLTNIHPPPSLQITPVVNNGARMAPPLSQPLMQTMQNATQHDSPSPNNNHQSLMPQNALQSHNEDSQTTMSDGHAGHEQENMQQMQMEMTNSQQQQQQQMANNYKMEHGM
ncbi:sex determination protein fruitless-like [Culicoides brevitarsis]|uniref:sex determination protein fruitless-like n=1 Tax=Culicoides brevitarsis TaxID=469753 RepID=UPI00307C7B00